MSLTKWRTRVERRLATYSASLLQRDSEEKNLRAVGRRLKALYRAQELVQKIAQTCQTKALSQISTLVTHCLLEVFEEPYAFHIDCERKRGKTETRLVFTRDGLEVNPIDEASGGVVDVAAFALRVASLQLAKPPRRKVLFLDEPFKSLQTPVIPRLRRLLVNLSKKTGIQIVLVTHIEILRAGKVIDFGDI